MTPKKPVNKALTTCPTNPLPRGGCGVESPQQDLAHDAHSGTRLLDTSSTLWLEPPSAAGARAESLFDPMNARTPALPRMGETWTPSTPQPASVHEAHRREKMHPQSLSWMRKESAPYPRARPPS